MTLHFLTGFFTNVGLAFNNLNFTTSNNHDITAHYSTLNMGFTAAYDKIYTNITVELFGVDYQNNNNEITSVERQDFTLTVGMSPIPQTIVFAGYTQGEMKDDFTGNFHTDDGLFVGGGYTYPVLRDSSLGVTLAYADLDGKINQDGASNPVASGDTTGFSIGVNLSGPYKNSVDYFISLRLRRYDFNSDSAFDGDKNITALAAGLSF